MFCRLLNGKSQTILTCIRSLICVAELLIVSGCGNQMIAAVNRNDLAAVKSLLNKGADINEKEETIGATALYQASFRGYSELAAFLIENSADIHAKTNHGLASLHVGAQEGHQEVVEMLIARGADIHAKTNKDYTALHYAALRGHPEIIEILITHGADIHAKSNTGATVLHTAAQGGHRKTVEKLIAHGADINVENKWNCTPLHTAARNNRTEVFDFLLDRGATINVTGIDTGTKGQTYYQFGKYYEKRQEKKSAALNYEKAAEHLNRAAVEATKQAEKCEEKMYDTISPPPPPGSNYIRAPLWGNALTGIAILTDPKVNKIFFELEEYQGLAAQYKELAKKSRSKLESLKN